MARKTGITSDIVLEYLNKWGNLPSLTLAKKIYSENKEAFTSIDTIRTVIRYYRGTVGDRNRSCLKNHKYIDYNPYRLPESESDEWFPFVIDGVEQIGILSDIHLPYHDERALTCALDYLKIRNVDCILLNGDIIDAYQVSDHQKDPRKRRMADEIMMLKEFFAMLRAEFPKTRIIYKLGNHEERYEKYLMVKAPELLNIPEFEFKNILNLDNLGIEFQTCQKQIFRYKSLNIIHGHELGKFFIPSVNPARGLFLRAKTSTMCGHFHRTSEHTEKDLNGKLTKYWSTGCLCELNPLYMPVNNWGHGAAILTGSGDDFHVENFSIIDGRKV